ncbi:pectin acetylesterase 8-like isoform X2 [Wolffia australiana]
MVRGPGREFDGVNENYQMSNRMERKRLSLNLVRLILLSLGALALASATDDLENGLTILHSAVAKGAVCLDGSPPGYQFSGGFGSGESSWLVHIEGGGWCHNVTNCLSRSKGRLGSTRDFAPVRFSGILNDHGELNPYFHNWNRVKVGYCDGSSFTGDVDAVDPATNLHYRGARIFNAVMEDLLSKGMRNATNALLSGCSAGGLTSLLHCDRFRALLPNHTRVKCLSDGGYFVNLKDISGDDYIKTYFQSIVETHGSVRNLPQSCTSKMEPNMCFFPQYVAPHVRTPLFILNAAYDSWQIRNVLVPLSSDQEGYWKLCRTDITKCDTNQIEAMQGFRHEFLNNLDGAIASTTNGFFINSCFAHCQTELTATWKFTSSPVLGNSTIAEAVGLWFYDLQDFREIDCPYPCDSTCYNNKYTLLDNIKRKEIPQGHRSFSQGSSVSPSSIQ